MKKLLALIVTVLLAVGMMTACAAESVEPEDTSAGEERVIAVLTEANSTEEEFAEMMAKNGVACRVVFYNDLNTMLLALRSGEADMISGLPEDTVDYIAARNPDMIKIAGEHKATVSYSMAVKQEDTELLESMNEAIRTLKDKGILDYLIGDYITAYTTGTDDPRAVELPVIEGAETVRIAATGDIPPMDLITAGGRPAGFNIALLAEMSKLMNVNFEPVSMDAAARTISIASDKVDAIFWITSYSDAPGCDLPDTLTATEPYYSGAFSGLAMRPAE